MTSPVGVRRFDVYPSEICGLRPCHTPTGQIHRPGSGSELASIVFELGELALVGAV